MKRTVVLTAALFCFSSQAFAGTCALCRQALAMGGNQGLIQGFYWSIVLIAGMPVLIGLFFWVSFRRGARRHKQSISPVQPVPPKRS